MKMPEIIAHRGSSGKYPENTMLAFEMAVKEGADAIETDVRMTKDGVLVIMHDTRLSRMSDDERAKSRITESNYDDIKDIDISSKNFPDMPVQHIAKLSDLLELSKRTGIALNIEIKHNEIYDDGAVYKIVELVEQYGLHDRVYYSAFNHKVLNNIKTKFPFVRIGLLYGATLYNVWDYAKGMDAYAVHPESKNHLIYGNSEECVKAGLKINAWTVNNAEDAKALVKHGVTGLITNFPKEIREAVNE